MSDQDSHVQKPRYDEGPTTYGHSYNHNQITGGGYTHFGDIRNEYNINIGAGSSALPSSLWTVTRPANTLFTGRDDVLDELETLIRNEVKDPSRRNPCNIVISGIGGQGKSEICLQLAHRLRPVFWGVFWIDFNTVAFAESGFRNIASLLHVEASTWEAGRQALANVSKPWLLVLDNADDPETDYQQYFPAGSSGVVILTSRNAECQCYATSKWVDLEGLSDKEAQELLFRAARTETQRRQTLEADALVVARLLRSHPLALIQAGSYIASNYCSIKDYPSVYERQRKRLLTFRPSQARSRYKDVYATFEASADALQSSCSDAGRDALELLPTLAMYEASRLPLLLYEAAWTGAQDVSDDEVDDDNFDIFTRWHVTHLPSLIGTETETWDPFRLLQAVNLLKAFSLVLVDTQEDVLYVSMHALIHAWAKDRLDPDQQHKHWVQSACTIALSHGNTKLWPKYERQMQPHVQAITSPAMSEMFGSEPPLQVCCVLLACGWLLLTMRADDTLFALIDRWLTYLCLDQLTVERQWVDIYYLSALNLQDHGQVEEAILLSEQVVKIRAGRLAVDHPDRLASQHALALVYRKNGQVEEAALLLEQMVKIEAQKLAEDHPDRLASQHELATCYWELDRRTEALGIMRQVVSIRRHSLDEDHPDRKRSEGWLHYFETEMAGPESGYSTQHVDRQDHSKPSSPRNSPIPLKQRSRSRRRGAASRTKLGSQRTAKKAKHGQAA